MIKKEGKIPVNCRVDVDYTGKNPKVKFGYNTNKPNKQAIAQHRYSAPLMITILILYVLTHAFIEISLGTNYPKEECNITKNIGITGTLYGLNVECGEDEYYFSLSRDNAKGGVLFRLKAWGILIILTIFLIIIFPRILLKSKRYKKNFPKNQVSKRRLKYYKFTKKDVENNMVEIPHFGNVLLDYKAKGDFNKYLSHIKIREHKYHNYKKGFGKKSKWKVGKLIRKDYTWYARFFFSKTPKDGYLRVIYQ